jgi:hypothetical protein
LCGPPGRMVIEVTGWFLPVGDEAEKPGRREVLAHG